MSARDLFFVQSPADRLALVKVALLEQSF